MQDTFRHLGSKIAISSSDNDAVANKLPTDNKTLAELINSVGHPVLNLDASDLSTLTLSNSIVTAWNDKSLSGNHGSAIAGSPIFEPAGQRLDVPSVRFNGVNSIVQGTNPVSDYPYTIIVIGTASNSNGPMFAMGSSAVNNRYITINWGGNLHFIVGDGLISRSAGTVFPHGASTSQQHRGLWLCRAPNEQSRDIRVNSFWYTNSTGAVGCPTLNRYRVGHNADSSTSEAYQGNIMQVIVWPHYIDDDSIRPLERALMSYWKIPMVRS